MPKADPTWERIKQEHREFTVWFWDRVADVLIGPIESEKS